VFKIREGVEWIKGPLSDLNLPGFLAYGAYVAEVLAPVPLILGVKARAAALVIAFQMFMAVVLVLRNDVFAIKQAGGGWAIELEALLFLTSLTLVFTGGGKYALSRQGRWD
jgi:putative oxidoreductase